MEWKLIPGYAMYEVSDEGKVRSRYTGSLLTEHRTPDGYLYVNIRARDGKQQRLFIHRLVALAHIGPCPDGHIVHHHDRVRHNNFRGNLEYMSEHDHKSEDAKARIGEKNYNAKLTDEEARRMYTLYHEHNVKQDVLCVIFGVSQSVVSRIVRGKGYTGS